MNDSAWMAVRESNKARLRSYFLGEKYGYIKQ